jgi:D-3-phosphoglycerate dehydrogenase
VPRVLVIQAIHGDALRVLDDRDDIDYEVVTDWSLPNLLELAPHADAITIRDAPLPPEVIDAAPNLRVVSRHGVGYDNVPVAACTARRIPVTIVGNVNTTSVAEHTMFLLLAAARNGAAFDAAVRAGDFGARNRETAVELSGRTMVVIGFGRIGLEVARRAHAFGMKVAAYDPWLTIRPPDWIELIPELPAALARADVVTLHVPLSDSTRNLIDDAALALLPDGAIVINTARGGLLDEAALVAHVRSGHLHGAGLDVFDDEPLPLTSPLVTEPRIVLSPHSAALSEGALIAMGVTTVRNALAGLDGTLDAALVVNPEVLRS